MKKIITIISLFSSVFTFGQCVKLYVKEHYSGDPICVLSPGSSLEICEEPGTVYNNGGTITGGNCTFYIHTIMMTNDAITYEFALDKTTPWFYAPVYGKLIVNTLTKKFGFHIYGNNRIGTYSYYNENEMSLIREKEKNEQDIQNKALEKEIIEYDQKMTNQINLAISKKEYFKANELYNNLNKQNSILYNEINTNLTPLKNKMDLLYSKYLSDFSSIEKEFFSNQQDFITKNKENISIIDIFLDGKDAYLERIKNTTNQTVKKLEEHRLETFSFIYENNKGQHYIAPVGVKSNYYTGLYASDYIDELQLYIRYDTLSQSYLSLFNFVQKGTIKQQGVVVNKNNYKVRIYSMPYPKQLKDLLNIAINQGCKTFVEENYPLLTIPLDNIERIPINSLNMSSNPGEGIKNKQYEELKNKFERINLLLSEYTSNKEIMLTNNFYNPILIYLMKKMYPNADTIVFAFEDASNTLGKLGEKAFRIRGGAGEESEYFHGENDFGSIIPLQKGVIEFKNNQLIIYQNNGNYSEIPLRIVENSVLSLSKISPENLELDSVFYGFDYHFSAKKIIEQNPIFFNRVQLGLKQETTAYNYITWKIGSDVANYIFNDSVSIQLLPTNSSLSSYIERPRFYNSRIPNKFDDSPNRYYKEIKEIHLLNYDLLRNYIVNMTKYFEYKKEGNLNKANKSKLKADKYLEKFKTLYFNMKYFY